MLDNRSKAFFFFFLNGFIEPFCLIKISRHSLHFACKTPAKGFNYFSARRAAWQSEPAHDRAIRIVDNAVFNLSGNDEADPCSPSSFHVAVLFFKIRVDAWWDREARSRFHGHRRPARFPRSRKDQAPIKFDSVARRWSPFCPLPSKISRPFNLISR